MSRTTLLDASRRDRPVQTTVRGPLPPLKWLFRRRKMSVGEGEEKRRSFCPAGGVENWYITEKGEGFCPENEARPRPRVPPPPHLAVSLLGIYPKEMKSSKGQPPLTPLQPCSPETRCTTACVCTSAEECG